MYKSGCHDYSFQDSWTNNHDNYYYHLEEIIQVNHVSFFSHHAKGPGREILSVTFRFRTVLEDALLYLFEILHVILNSDPYHVVFNMELNGRWFHQIVDRDF